MALNYLYGTLSHGAMQNMDTGDFTQFMLNPTQLQSQLTVNYAQKNTIGGSHQWLQYTHTSNTTLNLSLVYSFEVHLELVRGSRRFTQQEFAEQFTAFEDNRNFLLELCYPRGQANDPLRRSPPTVLLMWPKHVAIVCVVRSLQLTDKRFNQDQRPIEFTATVQLEEYRQHRLTSSEVRKKGFVRAKPRI